MHPEVERANAAMDRILSLQAPPSDKPHEPGQPHQPHDPRQPRREPGHSEPGPGGPKPPKDPNEPEEDEPPAAARSVSMTRDQFERFVQEMRKPVRDERAIARQQRTREHNRQLALDNIRVRIDRFHSCNHMQSPGSVMTGCSCIAWATQSDGKKRGTCQHCGTVFSAERSECLSKEIWEAYKMLVRLPTHPAGNINLTSTSA
jgi:hypothetical protein